MLNSIGGLELSQKLQELTCVPQDHQHLCLKCHFVTHFAKQHREETQYEYTKGSQTFSLATPYKLLR